MSKNRKPESEIPAARDVKKNVEPSGSIVAGGEVVNPRCDGCGKPGQWPLHADGQSHFCVSCSEGGFLGPQGFAVDATTDAALRKEARSGTGLPMVLMPASTVRRLEGMVEPPDFSDPELMAIHHMVINYSSTHHPSMIEHIRSVRQKLLKYAQERTS